MPVTFETDLKDLRPQTYTQQLPLDEMFRGLGYKQAEYDQGVQQAKAITQNMANVLRGYGQDEQMAANLKNQLNQELGKMSGLDFSDPANVNKLSSYVSSVANSPDVIGIASRTNAIDRFHRTVKDLEAKGQTVSPELQPVYQQMQDYLTTGKYDPKVRFNGEVVPDLDFNKLYDHLQKLPFQEKTTVDRYGNVTKVKSVTPDQVNDLLTIDPAMGSYMQRKADLEWAKRKQGMDDNTFSQQALQQDVNNYNKEELEARQELGRTQDKNLQAILAQRIQTARQARTEAQQVLGFGNVGPLYKHQFSKNFIKNELEKHIGAWSYTQEDKNATGTLEELKQQYEQQRELATTRDRIKQQALADAGMLTDENGTAIPGKAEIAGETASYKALYKKDGSLAGSTSNNMVTFHRYSKAEDDPDFVKDDNGKPKETDLSGFWKTLGGNLGVTDPGMGSGWKQINNQSFLKNWEKANDMGGPNQSTVGDYHGAPAVFVKGNKIIIGKSNDGGKTNNSYRVLNATNLFDAEVIAAPAKLKPMLTNAREQNLSGNFVTSKPEATTSSEYITLNKTQYKTHSYQGKAYPAPATQQEYDALPADTQYYDTDGVIKQKPKKK